MIPPEYLVPFLVSNVIAIGLLLLAVFRAGAARVVFVVIFIAAGLFNAYTALTQPQVYVETYSPLAVLPFYRAFIDGLFSRYTTAFILAIAAGQVAVGALLTRKGLALRLGLAGGVIFLAAIAPLGVGSAFPFSLFAIAALVVIYLKLAR